MRRPLRILSVEDSPDDSELILYELRGSNFNIEHRRVETADAMRQALSEEAWDIILSDYEMPNFDGLAALKLLKESKLDIPFIIISGTIGEETAVEALKSGAADYLIKGRLARLTPAVERALREAELRRLRRADEATIRSSLKEKELLLKEVHHRVKNNLQIFSSLINMQVQSLDGMSRHALEECQRRILAMALIHEKLYQSKDSARVPFSDYVHSLALNVFQAISVSPDTIALKFDIDDVPLEIDRAIPCGLILNELITNALKHAFPNGRKGTVNVNMKKAQNEKILLTVQDDGIGLPPQTDIRATQSLGFQLVNTLARQLKATIEIGRSHGTTFNLTLTAADT